MTYIKPTDQALTVHYATSAAHAASTLNERLRGVLDKAVAILGTNPYPPQSEACASDPLRRVVRASRSLIVVYRAEEKRLLIEQVRVEPLEEHAGAPAPAEPPPATERPAADVTEQYPRPKPAWERINPAPDGGAA